MIELLSSFTRGFLNRFDLLDFNFEPLTAKVSLLNNTFLFYNCSFVFIFFIRPRLLL